MQEAISKLERRAKVMATTKACPNNRRGNNAERFSTENPPAVVNAAPHMALPVVADAFSTQTCLSP